MLTAFLSIYFSSDWSSLFTFFEVPHAMPGMIHAMSDVVVIVQAGNTGSQPCGNTSKESTK